MRWSDRDKVEKKGTPETKKTGYLDERDKEKALGHQSGTLQRDESLEVWESRDGKRNKISPGVSFTDEEDGRTRELRKLDG